jgi:hypothetical protein
VKREEKRLARRRRERLGIDTAEADGNRMLDYRQAMDRLGILDVLRDHDPHIAGTLPLGIDVPGSDIDILCHAPDAHAFVRLVRTVFGSQAGFSIRQWTGEERPVIASFEAHGWTFELFGHPSPVRLQRGWRHFEIERRLLALGGAPFRHAVMERRRRGAKTEPAFADSLHLKGDPYATLLEIHPLDDRQLSRLLAESGFVPFRPSARPD